MRRCRNDSFQWRKESGGGRMRYSGDTLKRKVSNAARVSDAIRRNGSSTAGLPASKLNLTPGERAMLPDRDWVTEDDADAIVGLRRLKTQRPIPLEEALKQLGLDRPASTRRR